MTQNYDPTFDIYNTKWGTTGQTIQDFFDTIFTQNSGDTAPDNPVDGEPWLDTSDGLDNAVLKFYNGTEWVLANEYNPYTDELKLSRGSKDTLAERLEVALNEDGTLKSDLSENLTQWIDSGLIPTYIDANEFSVPGDNTDIFNKNRRIKATLDSSLVYSGIKSVNYDSGADKTNVTIYDEVLDSTLTKIEHGLIKPGSEGSQPNYIFNDKQNTTQYQLLIIDGSLAIEEV